MIDLRENLGWIIGSTVAGALAFLSWFYESGLLGTLIGIVIGVGITYFVQTRTQKRVWKREYALRNTETVYGPLFQSVDSALSYHSDESVPQGIYFQKWDEIKRTYQYLMIDEEFRNRLDRFSKRTENFSKTLQNLGQFAQKIIVEETRVAFPSHKEVFPEFNIKPPNSSMRHIHLSESLIRKEHPYKSALKGKKERETHEYFIALNPIKGGRGSALKYESDEKRIFDKLWEKCAQRFEQNLDVQTIRKEYPEIVKELRSIRKELIRRIQKPWKV